MNIYDVIVGTALIVSIILIYPFVLNALGKLNTLLTRLESGDIKFKMRGDTLYEIINDTPGAEIVGGMKEKSSFNAKRGLYYIGLPPFARIHTFKITKTRENEGGKDVSSWITEEEEVEVSSLRYTLTRPYVLKAVELGDRTPIDLLVVTKFEVVDPYIPVFNLKGRFFENAGSILKAAIIDILKNFTLDGFIAADKGEVKGILHILKNTDSSVSDFNKELIKQVGIRLVGISIPQYDPSDKKIRDAMNAQIIAEENKKATKIEAQAYADNIDTKTLADANRIKALGAASGSKIEEMAKGLGSANPDTIAMAIADILKSENIASSNITTWVEKGGNTKTMLPLVNKEKKVEVKPPTQEVTKNNINTDIQNTEELGEEKNGNN